MFINIIEKNEKEILVINLLNVTDIYFSEDKNKITFELINKRDWEIRYDDDEQFENAINMLFEFMSRGVNSSEPNAINLPLVDKIK